jgi:hypothetical protein
LTGNITPHTLGEADRDQKTILLDPLPAQSRSSTVRD